MKYKIYVLFLLFALASCNTQAVVATPTSTHLPTETSAPPTQISTPTATPTPPDIASTESAPETAGEGMVTYKNAEGNEVTVELATYAYTNSKGEVIEVVQPPDLMAAVKLMTDQSRWYPATTEQIPVDAAIWNGKNLHKLLVQYDIRWPPGVGSAVSAYPSEIGNPFMAGFIVEWDGGTLFVTQREDGSYSAFFYPIAPAKFDTAIMLDPQSAAYQYLLDLAAKHQ